MNRKEAILKAAAELFAARGFDATPTAEVAKAAGVAEGTIFHHFKTKDGSIRDVEVDKTAFILRGLLIGLTRQRLLGPIDLPDLSEEAVDFCHQSLACRV